VAIKQGKGKARRRLEREVKRRNKGEYTGARRKKVTRPHQKRGSGVGTAHKVGERKKPTYVKKERIKGRKEPWVTGERHRKEKRGGRRQNKHKRDLFMNRAIETKKRKK